MHEYGSEMVTIRRVKDGEPGIRRIRRGRGFSYEYASGRPVRDGKTLRRIRGLVIPPAWRDVWICRDGNGHIQATGVDDQGRKQYLYHEAWRRRRDAHKFSRLVEFAERLPSLRRDLHADLAQENLGRERVVAAVVRSLEHSFGRVGSERYARTNGSFGLSSLRCRHASLNGRRVSFRFPAKGGKVLEVEISDPDVVRVVTATRRASGGRLFRYQDEEGHWRPIRAADVNAYVKQSLGDGFSAKDLRTWAATVLLAARLHTSGARGSPKERKKVLLEAVRDVAGRLGNTEAVCKRSYLHPAIGAAYLDGSFEKRAKAAPRVDGLWPEEQRAYAILASYL
jgi:DNA topoisomerase I